MVLFFHLSSVLNFFFFFNEFLSYLSSNSPWLSSGSGPGRHSVPVDPRHLSDPRTLSAEQVVSAEHSSSKPRSLWAEEKTCINCGWFHWFCLIAFLVLTNAHICLRAEESLLWALHVGKFRMTHWLWFKTIRTLYWKTHKLHDNIKAYFVMKYWHMKTVISAYFFEMLTLQTWYSLIMFLMCNKVSRVVLNTTLAHMVCK